MRTKVDMLAEQIRELRHEEQQELLSRLTATGIASTDDWDDEIARDTGPGGRLERLLEHVHSDLAAGGRQPLRPIHIGRRYRALALLEDDSFQGFWIGTHAEYERLLSRP